MSCQTPACWVSRSWPAPARDTSSSTASPLRLSSFWKISRPGRRKPSRERLLRETEGKPCRAGWQPALHWQIDLEPGALSRLAVDPDPAAGFPDDVAHGRQTESAGAAFLLGRESRLEHIVPGFLIETRSRVADGEQRIGSAGDARFRAGRIGAIGDCLDGQRATRRHGFARVQSEVHQRLVYLSGVRLNAGSRWVQAHHPIDVFSR